MRYDVTTWLRWTVVLWLLSFGLTVPVFGQATGTITGTVTNAVTGAPVAGVWVWFEATTPSSPVPAAATDALGHYASGALPAGSYYAVANPQFSPGLLKQLYRNVPCPGGVCPTASGTPVVVTAGAVTPNIDFALQPGGTITGTVTKAATGGPASSVLVSFYDSGGARVGDALADGQGRYTSPGLVSGSYFVKAHAPSGLLGQLYLSLPCPLETCPVTNGTPVAVAEPQATPHIDFALQPVPAATHDFFANAKVIGPVPYADVSDTSGASTSAEDPQPTCGGGSAQRSVWYTLRGHAGRSVDGGHRRQ